MVNSILRRDSQWFKRVHYYNLRQLLENYRKVEAIVYKLPILMSAPHGNTLMCVYVCVCVL